MKTSTCLCLLLLAISMPRFALADQWQRSLFELGAQLGMAEQNAAGGGSQADIVKQLQRAKQIAVESNFPLAEYFDQLLEQAQGEPTETTIHAQIKQFREQLATKLSQLTAEDSPSLLFDCDATDWLGRWETNWGVMDLQRTADGRIEGRYGPSEHFVQGKVHPEMPCVFEGIWRHNRSDFTGRFQFKLTREGEFAGTWTVNDIDPAGKAINWTGTKHKASALTEESVQPVTKE